MLDVVAIVNNMQAFQQFTARSLAQQRGHVAVTFIDNCSGRHRSAASALNSVWPKLTGDWVLVAHQDLQFDSPLWLAEAESMLETSAATVAGVAGARLGIASTVERLSCITDGSPPQRAGHTFIHDPAAVQTVDECAFFVRRDAFGNAPFDADICGHWHLYAVDLCLSSHAQGGVTLALPLPLHHASSGGVRRRWGGRHLPWSYYAVLFRVLRKYRGSVETIATTCGAWSTRRTFASQVWPDLFGL